MAETASSTTKQSENQPNNIFVFLCNIPKFLLDSLLNFTQNLTKKPDNAADSSHEKSVKKDEEVVPVSSFTTPDVFRFPLGKHDDDVPPVKVEAEGVKDDTNPIILWQVYALGGYIILKWAWGKWQESKDKAKEDDSPDDDADDAPAADE